MNARRGPRLGRDADPERQAGGPSPSRLRLVRRVMYATMVLVALGAVLVWVSTDGAIAVVASVLAGVTAIAALGVARQQPRGPWR